MQKASEGFRWQELSLFLVTLNWVLCEPHQDKASEMFRGNVLKWSPSKLSLNLDHLMLVPLSHFFSVWQCPMLSRDNSRKHDSIILSRSFPSPWVTSRAPSDQEVIRDLVLDPNPDLEEEEVSRLIRESLDIQGHGSRYCHHSDTEALLATQAPGHGSQHPSKLELLLNVFCKKIVPNYLQRVNSSLRLWRCPDVSRQLPRARLRRGEEWAQSEGRTPATVCRALAALQSEYCHHCHTLPHSLPGHPAPCPASRGQLMPARACPGNPGLRGKITI